MVGGASGRGFAMAVAVIGWDSQPAATIRFLMRCPVKKSAAARQEERGANMTGCSGTSGRAPPHTPPLKADNRAIKCLGT